MKLRDLNPVPRRVYVGHAPENQMGGVPTDEFDLTFRCPCCGPPNVIAIRIGPSMKHEPLRVWQASPPEPTKDCPVPEWADRLTITPSINNSVAGHGRNRPACKFHGHITNGEVSFAP